MSAHCFKESTQDIEGQMEQEDSFLFNKSEEILEICFGWKYWTITNKISFFIFHFPFHFYACMLLAPSAYWLFDSSSLNMNKVWTNENVVFQQPISSNELYCQPTSSQSRAIQQPVMDEQSYHSFNLILVIFDQLAYLSPLFLNLKVNL